MSSRQFLINSIVKHQVFLNRYAGGTFNQLLPFIKKLEKKTIALLSKTEGTLTKARLNNILKELNNINKVVFTGMNKKAIQQMKALAKYEVDFTHRLSQQAVLPNVNFDVPPITQVQNAAFTSIIDGVIGVNKKTGITVAEALDTFGIHKAGEITSVIRQGFALGETIDQMTQHISTLIPKYERHARTLAQTMTNHVASTSRMQFYKQNLDLIEKFQVIATLDSHTTLTCINLDGQVFTIDEFIEPPYHWNCRSAYISVFNSDIVKQKDTFGRPSAFGEVSTQTKYASWLPNQPEKFQNEVLGPERAALMRAGMPVSNFVDENYQPINIDQLRTKDNEHIFEKARL